jgi:hypothetical protein
MCKYFFCLVYLIIPLSFFENFLLHSTIYFLRWVLTSVRSEVLMALNVGTSVRWSWQWVWVLLWYLRFLWHWVVVLLWGSRGSEYGYFCEMIIAVSMGTSVRSEILVALSVGTFVRFSWQCIWVLPWNLRFWCQLIWIFLFVIIMNVVIFKIPHANLIGELFLLLECFTLELPIFFFGTLKQKLSVIQSISRRLIDT